MKKLFVASAIGALSLGGGGCTTMPQNLGLSELETQQLTQRQICESEVRTAHDKYKNTKEWLSSGVLTAALAESTGDEDLNWFQSPLASLAIYAGIGYTIDLVQFGNKVEECMQSKTISEDQV